MEKITMGRKESEEVIFSFLDILSASGREAWTDQKDTESIMLIPISVPQSVSHDLRELIAGVPSTIIATLVRIIFVFGMDGLHRKRVQLELLDLEGNIEALIKSDLCKSVKL